MFCRDCGNELSDLGHFCSSCGSRKKFEATPFIAESSNESDLIKHYFKKGVKYETMLKLLEEHHGISMSLRTLKSGF